MKPVSKSEIEKMKALYEETICKSSTENLRKKFPNKPSIAEAQSAWVSKKELLELLEHNNANGLRIHYGCHHESTHSDPNADCHGLHNVILVATVDSVNPDNPTPGNSVDQLSDGNSSNTSAVTIAVENTDSYGGNGGDALPLCPPNCG
jgi:hypothetical protein